MFEPKQVSYKSLLSLISRIHPRATIALHYD
jgi:hypothetical protein